MFVQLYKLLNILFWHDKMLIEKSDKWCVYNCSIISYVEYGVFIKYFTLMINVYVNRYQIHHKHS